jgi:hypothetical protein
MPAQELYAALSGSIATDQTQAAAFHLGYFLQFKVAEWVASDGLLRTDEELIRAIFDPLPFERLGSRIRERLESIGKVARRHQQC